MKKLFVISIIVCAMFASCTKESFFDVENAKVESFEKANQTTFDKSVELYDSLMNVCTDLIETNKTLDYFMEILPEVLQEKISAGTYTIEDAVEIIHIWWLNRKCFDLMTECPAWDDFIPTLVKIPELWDKYDFYW